MSARTRYRLAVWRGSGRRCARRSRTPTAPRMRRSVARRRWVEGCGSVIQRAMEMSDEWMARWPGSVSGPGDLWRRRSPERRRRVTTAGGLTFFGRSTAGMETSRKLESVSRDVVL